MKDEEIVETKLALRLNSALIKNLSAADKREEAIEALLEEARRRPEYYDVPAFRELVENIWLELP